MLPNANDLPPAPAKFTAGFNIALHVARDLRVPKTLVARRSAAMLCAAVPKTAIHKDRKFRARKDEIRSSRKGGMPPPPVHFGRAKKLRQQQLGAFVSARADQGHDARPLGLSKDVRHNPPAPAFTW